MQCLHKHIHMTEAHDLICSMLIPLQSFPLVSHMIQYRNINMLYITYSCLRTYLYLCNRMLLGSSTTMARTAPEFCVLGPDLDATKYLASSRFPTSYHHPLHLIANEFNSTNNSPVTGWSLEDASPLHIMRAL